MQVIQTGSRYNLYKEDITVHGTNLPVQSYVVRFSERDGFYLERYFDIEINEDKLYGECEEKSTKVLRSFQRVNRNLGVILSGDKGIGKSLFAKVLASKSINMGYPLIVVDEYTPGIGAYLERIEQEVIILFDEFEKTFNSKGYVVDPQTELLPLFDGIPDGKKLFVVTCNSIGKLNEFLVNRPGRFHYHFKFDYPSGEEIIEYLKDKLDENMWGEIEAVVAFSCKVPLNYDCLRAIVFELNSGMEFKDAIKDLNIVNANEQKYDVTLYFENDKIATTRAVIDMFSHTEEKVWFGYENGDQEGDMIFFPRNCNFDPAKMNYYCNGKDIKFIYSDGDLVEKVKPLYAIIERCMSTNIHYVV